MPTFNQLVRSGRKRPRYKTASPALARVSAEARCLHPRVHADSQEAELGPAQSRPRPIDQWD